MDGTEFSVRFDVPATVLKWPSLNNSRRIDREPYLLLEGTLDQCIREFMAKPASTRHLYELRTAPQPPLVTATLSAEHIVELARLREFL
jgi:hypothetical protein